MSKRDERIKLAATYLNNLAVAAVAIGAFAPLVGGSVNPTTTAICILISGILHYGAQVILTRLSS